MGVGQSKESLEEKILFTRLERDQIRKERCLLLTEYKQRTGEILTRYSLPDYIDHKYYKELNRENIEKERRRKEKLERKRKEKLEKKEQERLEAEKKLEKEGYNEELLYQPMDLNVKRNYLDYEIDKTNKNNKTNKSVDNTKQQIEFLQNILDFSQSKKKIKKKNKDKNKEDKNEKKDSNKEGEIIYDNDIIQKIDAKIISKQESKKNILKGQKTLNTNDSIIISKEVLDKANKIKIDDSAIKDNPNNKIKISEYNTPHLQPND